MILNTKPQSVVQQGMNKIAGHVFVYKQVGGNRNIYGEICTFICFVSKQVWENINIDMFYKETKV